MGSDFFVVGGKVRRVLGLLIAIPIASFIKDTTDSWQAGEFNKIDDIVSEPVTVTNETARTYS